MKAPATPHSLRAFGSDRPVLNLAPVGREVELILSKDERRLVALLIPKLEGWMPLKACFALGRGRWKENEKLEQAWGCSCVLAEPAWAEEQLKNRAPRPQGTKIFFVRSA